MAYLTLFCQKFPTNSRKKSQRSGRGGGSSRFSQIPNFTEFFFKYLYQSLNLNLIVGPCTTLSRSHSIASAGDKSLALPGERSRYQTMIAKKSKHQQIKVKVYFPGLMQIKILTGCFMNFTLPESKQLISEGDNTLYHIKYC